VKNNLVIIIMILIAILVFGCGFLLQSEGEIKQLESSLSWEERDNNSLKERLYNSRAENDYLKDELFKMKITTVEVESVDNLELFLNDNNISIEDLKNIMIILESKSSESFRDENIRKAKEHGKTESNW